FASRSTIPPPPAPHPLSLHAALPISRLWRDKRTLCRNILPAAISLEVNANVAGPAGKRPTTVGASPLLLTSNDGCSRIEHLDLLDRKSTRLNSSHDQISYAVFCLKKK